MNDNSLSPFERRLRRLAADSARSDWDNDGSRAVPQALWDDARTIYEETRDLGVEPFISPGDGAVHLSWTDAGRHISLELTGDQAFLDEADSPEAKHRHRKLARAGLIAELKNCLRRKPG